MLPLVFNSGITMRGKGSMVFDFFKALNMDKALLTFPAEN
jgi:hypothetical protein